MRQAIIDDLERNGHDLLAIRQTKKMNRKKGWTKIKSKRSDITGALNIEWDAKQQMLIARAVGRRGNKPYSLLGIFLDYLMEFHAPGIRTINIQLQ
jgi:hypothetical protein